MSKAVDEAEPKVGSSPTHIANPELRKEAKRAAVWAAVIGIAVLAVYISQALLVIFGAMVFAAMLDGGARLLGRVMPVGRGWRLALVIALMLAFIVWLFWFAGSQISQQAAQLPALVAEQLSRLIAWLQSKGFAASQDDVSRLFGTFASGVGIVTRAIGGILGAGATLLLVVTIGLYLAFEPRLYERGLAWMLPQSSRGEFYITAERMAFTLRRLMAGRLVGMAFEGVFTFLMLFFYGVPMAALLGIITGLLAFIPNIGAIVSGILMVLVGFSGGTEMGLYTIFVYVVVQNVDGNIVVPLIARRTVDLAPALVLAFQLIMGILFGILGLFLADPLLALTKLWLTRRAEIADLKRDGA
uniref:AI-2E family transporter n=1 Tax=Altererythrobacter segetis TaxID=1104773 RepID=UPI00140B3391|nr:AI-2E family transporter [Altererythrobacter segetis]